MTPTVVVARKLGGITIHLALAVDIKGNLDPLICTLSLRPENIRKLYAFPMVKERLHWERMG